MFKFLINLTWNSLSIQFVKFANEINGLAVKFVRLDFHDELQAEMLVMERLKPMDFRAYEVEIRELWFDVFEQLHQAGLCIGI